MFKIGFTESKLSTSTLKQIDWCSKAALANNRAINRKNIVNTFLNQYKIETLEKVVLMLFTHLSPNGQFAPNGFLFFAVSIFRVVVTFVCPNGLSRFIATQKNRLVFLLRFCLSPSSSCFCLNPLSSSFLSVFVFIHLHQIVKPKHKRVFLCIPIQKILETGK